MEITEEAENDLPIEEAEVVVAAGWGVNALGSMDLVRELAEVLEGAVAGTRPLLDKGWITSDCMIGQSGKVIGPNLLVSLGASGAMHFSTGFERAKFVLAVDQNPLAPIFQSADVGIVGDLREVLPPFDTRAAETETGLTAVRRECLVHFDGQGASQLEVVVS